MFVYAIFIYLSVVSCLYLLFAVELLNTGSNMIPSNTVYTVRDPVIVANSSFVCCISCYVRASNELLFFDLFTYNKSNYFLRMHLTDAMAITELIYVDLLFP